MSKTKTTSWAIRIRGSLAADLEWPKMPKGWEFFKPGPEVKGMLLEIMNRRTGETGMFVFLGVGIGTGIGRAEVDLGGWEPFNTINAITLRDFERTARLYNAGLGLGIGVGVGGIVFHGIEVYRDSFWEDLWYGDSIDVGGLTAGSGFDISEDIGKVMMVGHQESADTDAYPVLDDQPDANSKDADALYTTSLPDADVIPVAAQEDAFYPTSLPSNGGVIPADAWEDALYPTSLREDGVIPADALEDALYPTSLPDDDIDTDDAVDTLDDGKDAPFDAVHATDANDDSGAEASTAIASGENGVNALGSLGPPIHERTETHTDLPDSIAGSYRTSQPAASYSHDINVEELPDSDDETAMEEPDGKPFSVSHAGWDAALRPDKAVRLNADLVSFRPPTWVQWEVNSTSAHFHHIENGLGPINLDFYPVAIDQPPTVDGRQMTATELLEHVRTHLNEFLDNDVAEFTDLGAESRAKWHSPDPVGATKSFQIDIPWLPGAEGASVVVTEATPTSWIFSTIYTDEDTSHPVSGNREFGVSVQDNGSVLFYTRGADRVTDMVGVKTSDTVFAGAHALWVSLQVKVAEFVNEHGGQARVGLPLSERFPWDVVSSESFNPTIAWEDLGDAYNTTRPAQGETWEQWEARIAVGLDPWLKVSPGVDPYTAWKLGELPDEQEDALYPTSLPDDVDDSADAFEQALYPTSLPDDDSMPTDASEEALYPTSLPDDGSVSEDTQYPASLPEDGIVSEDVSHLTSLPEGDVAPAVALDDASYPISQSSVSYPNDSNDEQLPDSDETAIEEQLPNQDEFTVEEQLPDNQVSTMEDQLPDTSNIEANDAPANYDGGGNQEVQANPQ